MNIRPAGPQDADVLAQLVLSSASRLLGYIFAASPARVQQFLTSGLSQAKGQYGYENHLVIAQQGQVIGAGSCWHSALPEHFDRATMVHIHQFWGLQAALDIVTRSQNLTPALTSTTADTMCIGHMAVLPEFQRQGAARALLEHFSDAAKSMGLSQLTLDVEADNLAAIALYRKAGFVSAGEPSAVMLGDDKVLLAHMQMAI